MMEVVVIGTHKDTCGVADELFLQPAHVCWWNDGATHGVGSDGFMHTTKMALDRTDSCTPPRNKSADKLGRRGYESVCVTLHSLPDKGGSAVQNIE
jgi:hypothetical protein